MKRRGRSAGTTRRRDVRAVATIAGGGVAVLLGAGLFLAALGGPSPPPAPDDAPHWTLRGADGRAVTDGDFRGRFVLLYFGYTSCPDICPTALAAVSDAMARLGTRARRLQPVFVSIDPLHDTPADVAAYARLFGNRLVGLVGTPAETVTIERDYGIEARVRRTGGADLINHTSVFVLLGPGGRVVSAIPADENGTGIARRLARLVS